ncbi:translation initiation factor IF-2 [Candidatus Woesearchaeota archaeon]|nr:translation initiation factor IF-2 [Candidatus Woesearchaeota archaeon]
MLRQPIVTILGHVDHGKTSLLDYIRGSAVAAKEAGGITQAIGASIVPLEVIRKTCGSLLDALKLKLTIPGLLFIDTPGHAAFINLRKRGGNLADIAILVIDITKGLEPQTVECIQILKQYKTPFVVALNKIDTLDGWKRGKGLLLKQASEQQEQVQRLFETKLYEIVGKLFELGINAERFDRVPDYTKTIALVPTSAKTGDGVPELLMVLTGLAQKFLESSLKAVDGPAKGTVLEVKETAGLGVTMDAIVYEGVLKAGDTIVIGSSEEPLVTKVKAILVPAALAEMREKKTKFQTVKTVSAAMGVKLSAPDIDNVQAGMPFIVAHDVEKAKLEIQGDVEAVTLQTAETGVIIKADTLGSLEALSFLLQEKNIPVTRASVGPITKKDLSDAQALIVKDPLFAVILGFNIPAPDVSTNIKVFTNPIIYRLIEDYEAWKAGMARNQAQGELDKLTKPAKIQLLAGYVFRQSNPAVVGTEVLAGTLRPGTRLMRLTGEPVTEARTLQDEQESITEAKKGRRIAVSYPDVVIGRQLKEGDILYSSITENEFRQFKEFKDLLTNEEKELLKEIASLMREKNPVWGV